MPDENSSGSEKANPDSDEGKVLIVDDSPVMRKILEKILTSNDYVICGEADDGDQVLDLYMKLKPDVVTLDLNMPTVDGLTALRQIMDFDPNARVIMLTGAEEKNDILEAVSLGARGYIIKPPNREVVLEKVRSALEG